MLSGAYVDTDVAQWGKRATRLARMESAAYCIRPFNNSQPSRIAIARSSPCDGGVDARLRESVKHFQLRFRSPAGLALELDGERPTAFPQQQVGCAGHHAHALEDCALDCGACAAVSRVQVDHTRRAASTKMLD